MIPYDDFLRKKVKLAQSSGFPLDLEQINPALKPHNKLMVKWLVEGGRRACFASFGLHKTVTQLETVRCTLLNTGGRGLIICPLGVRQEFVRDAVQILGTLNSSQYAKGKVMHLCPLQLDIAQRAITQWTNPGEIVADPFGGIATVPSEAVKLGRQGWGCELSPQYFIDGAAYCKAAEHGATLPTLFDLIEENETQKTA
jgi:hypothetical protein